MLVCFPGACECIVATHKCHDAVNENGSVREGQRHGQRPDPNNRCPRRSAPLAAACSTFEQDRKNTAASICRQRQQGLHENPGCFLCPTSFHFCPVRVADDLWLSVRYKTPSSSFVRCPLCFLRFECCVAETTHDSHRPRREKVSDE